MVTRHGAAAAVLGVILAAAALVACGEGDSSTGAGTAQPTSSETDGSAAKEIQVGDSDALRWGDGARGVVLAHGAAFDAASWGPQATRFAEEGATVIAVEDTTPDVIEAAVAQLREAGAVSVALVGGSAGADAILELASAMPNLPDQLILLSANGVVDGLGEEPKLFIASEGDPVAHVSTELAASAPGGDNQVMILPGSDHAQNIFDGEQGDKVLDVISRRLQSVGG